VREFLRFAVYGLANAAFLFALWRLTRPKRLCGPGCKHPDTRLANTRYVVCERCPVRDACTPDTPCQIGD
jgi:hypothetical protein